MYQLYSNAAEKADFETFDWEETAAKIVERSRKVRLNVNLRRALAAAPSQSDIWQTRAQTIVARSRARRRALKREERQ